MNSRLRIAFLFVLFSIAMIPLAEGATQCPLDCTCLSAANALKLGYGEYCGGKPIICDYDVAKNPMYCYQKPVTTTAPPAFPACSANCLCLNAADAKAKGYTALCADKQTLCGYDTNQNPMYCYTKPTPTPTTPTPTTPAFPACAAGCLCLNEVEAKAKGAIGYCNGTRTICGYDINQNPMYCFGMPATATPTAFEQCPAGCTCTGIGEAEAKGLSYCGGKQILCGITVTGTNQYCFQAEPLCPSGCDCIDPTTAARMGISALCNGEKRVCAVIGTEWYCYQRSAVATCAYDYQNETCTGTCGIGQTCHLNTIQRDLSTGRVTFGECTCKAPEAGDTTGPVIDLKREPHNLTNTDWVLLSVKASDPGGVGRIEILLNGERVKECLNVTECNFTGGPYDVDDVVIEARASDLRGNTETVRRSARVQRVAATSVVDTDGDTIMDRFDNCRYVKNRLQEDYDNDGVGDACDCEYGERDCPYEVTRRCETICMPPDPRHPIMECHDWCDERMSRPSYCGGYGTMSADDDGDGIRNGCDNCPRMSNPGQEDRDYDGIGDACDRCPDTPKTVQQIGDDGCEVTIPCGTIPAPNRYVRQGTYSFSSNASESWNPAFYTGYRQRCTSTLRTCYLEQSRDSYREISPETYYEDTCERDNVIQYRCTSGSLQRFSTHCNAGCRNGACICEDSDGGVQYFVRGTTSTGMTDTCLDANRLREYFTRIGTDTCDTYYENVTCPDGCQSGACRETCSDGIRNQDETGIDCGGSCPAVCSSCWEDGSLGGGDEADRFSLGSTAVRTTASVALMEYADCLRNATCRSGLPTLNPIRDYSTVRASDLQASTDDIMEAVAYYVDKHMQWIEDDLWGSGAPNIQSARYTIEDSGSRCSSDYCGDCEDHAILRNALMRVLGISWRCAFCVDYMEGYSGLSGHTFNVVKYRNKYRIMDYGPLGYYFNRRWGSHRPDSLWNDHLGEYWCTDGLDNILGPGGCDKVSPQSYTWNYAGGEHCPASWKGEETYHPDTCP